ncbi:MAG: ABC transporter permease [Candidatus Ratteibacteria bacterium]|jgi:putative ABC transport system permease protein
MISVSATIKISLRALQTNKIRSGLTILGIVIGVGAVIAMLAIGNGARQQITDQISSIGSNLLMVRSGSSASGGVRMGAGTQPTLTLLDAEAIIKDCPSVTAAAPVVNGGAQAINGNKNWSTSVTGSTPDFLEVRDWQVAEGRSITDQDVRSAAKVCLLGATVVDNLFGDQPPTGKVIRLKNMPFMVVGMLASKGQSAMGQDQDDVIIVPVTTAQKKLFGTSFPGMVNTITVKANSAEGTKSAQQEIENLLKRRHHIGLGKDPDFTVRDLTQIMQAAEQSSQVMTILLGAIASISLLVGGIGVMNIMLVSVAERTREIGIRMAVGAKTWDIRLQFITEALTLSLIGGIIGIMFGVIGAKVISVKAGWPTAVSLSSIMMSFGFSGFVGIFFGFYPAYKASLLNPIDALRYE